MEIEKMSFEEALKKLEGENIQLEESIEKFELGVKLSSHCLSKLNEAEKKIEELTRSDEGKLIAKELKMDE